MPELWLESTIACGILGYVLWVALDPTRRLGRLGAILPTCSLVAWAIFLVFGEPFDPSDAPWRILPDGSVEIWHDGPVMVAGRAVGTFGSVNLADRLLSLMAQPAILYSWQVVTFTSGIEAEASVWHSYVVAGMASVFSGAFWLAAGNGLAAVYARRRRAAQSRSARA